MVIVESLKYFYLMHNELINNVEGDTCVMLGLLCSKFEVFVFLVSMVYSFLIAFDVFLANIFSNFHHVIGIIVKRVK